MLDLDTLRVVQAAVAICAFVLVFFGTFRATRAPFAGWWSAAVASSGLSTVAYVAIDASSPVAAAAVGNAISVVGAFFTWSAARSLLDRQHAWWAPVGVGIATALATAFENPTGEAWPGGGVLLVGMALFVGLAAADLWRLSARTRPGFSEGTDGESFAAVFSMAFASTTISLFYVLRIVVYATLGPDSWFYHAWAGPLMTTFVMTLMLLVVTYSVTTLSHYEISRHWKLRAMNDDLTGLFTRKEFDERARHALDAAPGGASPAVIVADLDHFKAINDRHGHAEGDRALVAYADAIGQTLGSDDIAARFGGDELVLLLVDTDGDQIAATTRRINAAFGLLHPSPELRPTVSYGAALWDGRLSLGDLVARADDALYLAKQAGRNKLIIADDPMG